MQNQSSHTQQLSRKRNQVLSNASKVKVEDKKDSPNIAQLKQSIIDESKKIALNQVSSAFNLTVFAKELIRLEAEDKGAN